MTPPGRQSLILSNYLTISYPLFLTAEDEMEQTRAVTVHIFGRERESLVVTQEYLQDVDFVYGREL